MILASVPVKPIEIFVRADMAAALDPTGTSRLNSGHTDFTDKTATDTAATVAMVLES